MIEHADNVAQGVPEVKKGAPRSSYQMINGVEHKRCPLCLNWLPTTSFWKNRGGFQARCKTCLGPQLRANQIKRTKRVAAVEGA